MQVILKNKDKRDKGGRTNLIGTILYAKRISRCVERECIRGFRNKKSRV